MHGGAGETGAGGGGEWKGRSLNGRRLGREGEEEGEEEGHVAYGAGGRKEEARDGWRMKGMTGYVLTHQCGGHTHIHSPVCLPFHVPPSLYAPSFPTLLRPPGADRSPSSFHIPSSLSTSLIPSQFLPILTIPPLPPSYGCMEGDPSFSSPLLYQALLSHSPFLSCPTPPSRLPSPTL
ncbi:unnamed protein product [Closterium sp. NIES-53]